MNHNKVNYRILPKIENATAKSQDQNDKSFQSHEQFGGKVNDVLSVHLPIIMFTNNSFHGDSACHGSFLTHHCRSSTWQ